MEKQLLPAQSNITANLTKRRAKFEQINTLSINEDEIKEEKD